MIESMFVKTKTFLTEWYKYRVDITEDLDGRFEAWLWHQDYGIKMYMFGCYESEQRFLEMVEDNLERYIKLFQSEYRDKEDELYKPDDFNQDECIVLGQDVEFDDDSSLYPSLGDLIRSEVQDKRDFGVIE